MIKILIDRGVCIGASACVAAAGKTFALDQEGKSTVINPEGNSKADIRAAAASCPTQAIQISTETKSPSDKP